MGEIAGGHVLRRSRTMTSTPVPARTGRLLGHDDQRIRIGQVAHQVRADTSAERFRGKGAVVSLCQPRSGVLPLSFRRRELRRTRRLDDRQPDRVLSCELARSTGRTKISNETCAADRVSRQREDRFRRGR